MYMAINMNRADFVKEFLDRGFILSKFLTYRCLLKLFNDVYKFYYRLVKKKFKLIKNFKYISFLFKAPKNSTLFNYLKITKSDEFKLDDSELRLRFKDIGYVIQNSLRNFYIHEFCSKPFNKIETEDIKKIIQQTVINFFYDFINHFLCNIFVFILVYLFLKLI